MNANARASVCDPNRYESFLSGSLSAADEQAFASHLNTCDDCRRALEEQAAEPEAWQEAAELLAPATFEWPAADEAAGRQPLEIQHVLDALGPTDDPEMLGRLGGYEVSGVVGAGGMGVVLKAIDRSLDRTVAIKVLAPHLAMSGAARKRFAREAKAAAAVLHPNVIAIHSVSNDESLPYLVMPYVRGTSLQKRLDREGPLALPEILRIGSQVAAGLAAAHAQGLVHRDIKPANILLEDGIERVTITDFGLARATDDATITHSGMIAGTPQYMSPEQARGESVDQRSDLFSLGSVLFAICTGRPPFRADTTYGVMRRITDDEPASIRELNPEIPEWLAAIALRLMAKRAADRFASAAEVAELLAGCLAHVQQPEAVKLPASLPTHTSAAWSGFRWLGGGIAAIFGTLSLLFAGLALLDATEPPDIAGNWTGEEWGEVVLKQTGEGEYAGAYTDTFGKLPGEIELKWSRIERRYYGVWREGADRFGDLSVRLVGKEIRGAHTTDPRSKINPATPRLADSAWRRSPAKGARPDLPHAPLWPPVGPGQPRSTARDPLPTSIPRSTDAKGDEGQFSETRQIVLSMDSLKFMLDLDTGATMDCPARAGRPGQELMDVHPDQVQPYHYPRGLSGLSLEGREVKEGDWDVSPGDVRRALAGAGVGPLKHMDQGPEKHPTYFFKTREGTYGVLQLLGLVDEPRGIRICYKTVKESPAAAPVPLPAGQPTDEPRAAPVTDPNKPKSVGLPAISPTAAGPRASLPTRLLATKEHVAEIQKLIKSAPVTTNYLAELFELTPGSKSDYRLRSDVVSIPIVAAEKSAVDFIPLGQVLYMPASKGFYLQWDSPGASSLHYYGSFHGVALDRLGAPAPPSPTFGPVIERLVPKNAAPAFMWFDLDTGKAFSAAEAFPGRKPADISEEEYWNWRTKNGIDVAASFDGPGELKSLDREFFALPVNADQWDKMTPELLDGVFQATRIADQSHTILIGDRLPSTHVFRTRQGGRGILQITAINGQPHGLNIRYKLVQPVETPASQLDPRELQATTRWEFEPKSVTPRRLRAFQVLDNVNSIAASPDGKLIAVANGNPTFPLKGWKRSALLLDAPTGHVVTQLDITTPEEDAILAATEGLPHFEIGPLAFSPDRGLLAVGTGIGQVKLFSTRTGEWVRALDDEAGKLAETKTPEQLKKLKRAMGGVYSLAFSPDGSLLAVTGSSFEDAARGWGGVSRLGRLQTGPGRVKVWDVKTGKLLVDLAGHSDAESAAFSDDGSLLATSGRWASPVNDGAGVIVWNPRTGERLSTFKVESNGSAYVVRFVPASKLVAIASDQHDKDNGRYSTTIRVVHALSGITEWQQVVTGWAKPKAFGREGKIVVVLCEGKTIRLFDTATGKLVGKLATREFYQGGRWNDVAVATNAGLLIVGGVDEEGKGSVMVWDLGGNVGEAPAASPPEDAGKE